MRCNRIAGTTPAALAVAANLLFAPAALAQGATDDSLTPDAQATTVKSGSRRTQLTLFGQVNRALLRVGDGDESGVFFVDNDYSSTRVGLGGEAAATAEITFGSTIVFAVWGAYEIASRGISNLELAGVEPSPLGAVFRPYA